MDWAWQWERPDSYHSYHSCISCGKAGVLSTGSLFIINFNAKYYYYIIMTKNIEHYVYQILFW